MFMFASECSPDPVAAPPRLRTLSGWKGEARFMRLSSFPHWDLMEMQIEGLICLYIKRVSATRSTPSGQAASLF